METRTIAGREVMTIGFGAMEIDEYEPKPEDEIAIELLKYAVESGVTLIDTADVYGLGRNEALIGKALSDKHKEILFENTWLRFGLHALDNDTAPYSQTPDQQIQVFHLIYREIERFSGASSKCKLIR